MSTAVSNIFSCRWNWCRETFSRNEELIDHVMSIHVPEAEFVKRKDIPLLRRTEQGFGTFSSQGLGSNASLAVSQPVSTAADLNITQEPQEVVPSLQPLFLKSNSPNLEDAATSSRILSQQLRPELSRPLFSDINAASQPTPHPSPLPPSPGIQVNPLGRSTKPFTGEQKAPTPTQVSQKQEQVPQNIFHTSPNDESTQPKPRARSRSAKPISISRPRTRSQSVEAAVKLESKPLPNDKSSNAAPQFVSSKLEITQTALFGRSAPDTIKEEPEEDTKVLSESQESSSQANYSIPMMTQAPWSFTQSESQ